MVGWSTLRTCLAATPRPSAAVARTSRSCLKTRRRTGFVKKGGRKSCLDSIPALEDNLCEVVCDHTAGDPLREDVIWTYLSSSEIAEQLDERGTPVCTDTVRSLLKRLGFSRRKVEKTKTMGDAEFRNEQFENIAALQAEYFAAGNPVISMDTKKKEHLGEFARSGVAWTNGTNAVWDHDFPSFATGVVIPHGLYDLGR